MVRSFTTKNIYSLSRKKNFDIVGKLFKVRILGIVNLSLLKLPQTGVNLLLVFNNNDRNVESPHEKCGGLCSIFWEGKCAKW